MKFRRRLKRARKAAGYTQTELAKCLGIGQSVISWYEIGRRLPPVLRAIELSLVLRVSLDYLFGLRDE